MADLYILGAGCSRNYAQYDGPVVGLEPPLNADFFQMARRIVNYYKLERRIVGLSQLLDQLSLLYGRGKRRKNDTRVLDDKRLTLEDVMNHFYTESQVLLRDMPSTDSGVKIDALLELLAYTLAEALNGDQCNKHIALAKRMKPGDVVWSFNYDILVDHALCFLGKLTDSGYVFPFDYTLGEDNIWQSTLDLASSITLMKLHGSLNWLRCRNCGRKLLLRNRKSQPALWSKIRDLDIHCPICQAGSARLSRIVVPPAAVKSFEDLDMRYLWKSAPKYCSRVDRIVFIGYSFPQVDYELEMLFRTMIRDASLTNDVPITIVNPRPKPVRRRIAAIFNGSKIRDIKSLEMFLV
jgi:hypothetical protein